MLDIYHQAGQSIGYWPQGLVEIVNSRGRVGAAKYLMAQSGVSAGFQTLKRNNRLDLLVESLVLRAEWEPLFTDEEWDTARRKLEQFGGLSIGQKNTGTLPRWSPKVINVVESALEEYERQVSHANSQASTKQTYRNPARHFVRWMKGEFISGQRRPNSSHRS